MGADAGPLQPECVGDTTNQEIHPVARRDIRCNGDPQTCRHKIVVKESPDCKTHVVDDSTILTVLNAGSCSQE